MNVVVENEKVCKELLQKKCTYYPVTFIPLNKIQSEPIDTALLNRVIQLTNGKARLAKDLIDYDPRFERAMNFVFGHIVSYSSDFLVHSRRPRDCQKGCL